jgi:Fe2+ transport system protein FeoA
MKTAAELKFGEKVVIDDVDTEHPSSRRILEVGFTPGQEIELINISAFNDPMAFLSEVLLLQYEGMKLIV